MNRNVNKAFGVRQERAFGLIIESFLFSYVRVPFSVAINSHAGQREKMTMSWCSLL